MCCGFIHLQVLNLILKTDSQAFLAHVSVRAYWKEPLKWFTWQLLTLQIDRQREKKNQHVYHSLSFKWKLFEKGTDAHTGISVRKNWRSDITSGKIKQTLILITCQECLVQNIMALLLCFTTNEWKILCWRKQMATLWPVRVFSPRNAGHTLCSLTITLTTHAHTHIKTLSCQSVTYPTC